jgi:hypothetical protein
MSQTYNKSYTFKLLYLVPVLLSEGVVHTTLVRETWRTSHKRYKQYLSKKGTYLTKETHDEQQ